MRFFSREPVKVQPAPRPKKNNCKIRFKKTKDGEQIEFSPECTASQIEMARQMRGERMGE